jgi:hypothetical protein
MYEVQIFTSVNLLVTLRGSVLKRWRRQKGDRRWNGRKVMYVKWGDLHTSRPAFMVMMPEEPDMQESEHPYEQ